MHVKKCNMIPLVYLGQKWHTHTASIELKPATLYGGCMDSVLRSVQGRADVCSAPLVAVRQCERSHDQQVHDQTDSVWHQSSSRT